VKEKDANSQIYEMKKKFGSKKSLKEQRREEIQGKQQPRRDPTKTNLQLV
jgi:hypothetical protein